MSSCLPKKKKSKSLKPSFECPEKLATFPSNHKHIKIHNLDTLTLESTVQHSIKDTEIKLNELSNNKFMLVERRKVSICDNSFTKNFVNRKYTPKMSLGYGHLIFRDTLDSVSLIVFDDVLSRSYISENFWTHVEIDKKTANTTITPVRSNMTEPFCISWVLVSHEMVIIEIKSVKYQYTVHSYDGKNFIKHSYDNLIAPMSDCTDCSFYRQKLLIIVETDKHYKTVDLLGDVKMIMEKKKFQTSVVVYDEFADKIVAVTRFAKSYTDIMMIMYTLKDNKWQVCFANIYKVGIIPKIVLCTSNHIIISDDGKTIVIGKNNLEVKMQLDEKVCGIFYWPDNWLKDAVKLLSEIDVISKMNLSVLRIIANYV